MFGGEQTIENVNELLHWSTNICGLLANLWLMYLIIKKTPENLRPYAVLIFNFALTDGVACIAAYFVMQRIIPFGWHLAYISYGPCTRIGPSACYIGYCFQLHCYAHTLNSMIASFAYRLHILKKPPPSLIKMAALVFAMYLPSFGQAITFIFAMDDPDKIRKILSSNFPEYNITGVTVTGHISILNFWSLYTIFYLTIPCVPAYLIIMAIRKKIFDALSTVDMSEKTRETHLKLVRALTYQACLPGFFIIAVGSYAIEQLSIFHHPILEFIVFQSVGAIPVLSPFLSLVYVAPYRRATRNLLMRIGICTRKPKKRRIATERSNTVTSTYSMTATNLESMA